MTEKIPYKDFAKLNLQVGKILKAEDHPNADRLYILTVDFGEEQRTIVAGLKEHYKKEELENKKAVFITNLEPAKIRGIESNGMILAATSKGDKTVSFLTPEKDVDIGSNIK